VKQTKLLEPKQAAIEAGVFTQQVYDAIAKKLLAVERRRGRVFVRRESFKRWKANLQARRRMRIEEQRTREAAPKRIVGGRKRGPGDLEWWLR